MKKFLLLGAMGLIAFSVHAQDGGVSKLKCPLRKVIDCNYDILKRSY